jgi:hypothetical protein
MYRQSVNSHPDGAPPEPPPAPPPGKDTGTGEGERATTTRPSAWAAGVSAIRRFARPFVVIQSLAVALVTAYRLDPGFRRGCATLAELRTRGGVPFSALAGAVAGGVLPELMKWLVSPRTHRFRGRRGEIVFNLAFFTLNGVVIDRFYRGLGWLFGAGVGLASVAGKVAIDQFIFTPVWLLAIVALYTWRGAGFRLRPTLAVVRPGFYRARVLPLLLPNWAFWIPMTSAIYALPAPLQFLLFTLALAAWSLIMVFIAEGRG